MLNPFTSQKPAKKRSWRSMMLCLTAGRLLTRLSKCRHAMVIPSSLPAAKKTRHPWCLYTGLPRMPFRGWGTLRHTAAISVCMQLIFPVSPEKALRTDRLGDGTAFAEWLEDVLDSLGIQQTSLLGLSQGGWTALRFAASYPQRVERLVLLAPGGIVPVRSSFILKAVFFSMFGHWGADKINRLVLGKQPMHPEAVSFMNSIYAHFKTRRGKEYLFTDDELSRLNMPTLLIVGKEDALFDGNGIVSRMQKLVPQLEPLRIADMGHALVNLSGRIIPFLTR